jgi:hypothetical protein
MTVRLIGHEESFEVRYSATIEIFYFDEHPDRRVITKRVSKEVALEDAKALPFQRLAATDQFGAVAFQ